jgi:hypothetical protein
VKAIRPKRQKRAQKTRSIPPATGISEQHWQLWETNRRVSLHEFIRTGRNDDADRVQTELETQAAKCLNGTVAESAADRWGIDAELFNKYCEYLTRRRHAEPTAVYHVVDGILGRLMRRALQGDRACVAVIAKIAHNAASNLEGLWREQPQQVRELTEKAASIPILISKHKDMSGRAFVEAKLRDLNVGAHAAVNFSGFDMRPSRGQPFKNALHVMCDRLCRAITSVRGDPLLPLFETRLCWWENARRLSGLSEYTTPATAAAWFEVAWAALCEATANRPEELELLKGLADYKEHKRLPSKPFRSRGKFSNGRQAGLHERLKKAWLARYARTK